MFETGSVPQLALTCRCGASLTLLAVYGSAENEDRRHARERAAFDAAHAVCREKGVKS